MSDNLPAQRDALRGALESAETPLQLAAVVDLSKALAGYARRLRRSALAGDVMSMARDAYRAEVDATFASLEVIVRAAEVLPDQGARIDLSPEGISAGDFGIGHNTAARWKRQGGAMAKADREAQRARWSDYADLDPEHWPAPTIAALLRDALAGSPLAMVDTPALPDGQYRCIVADPPWPMQRMFRELYPGTGAHLDYPTMTVEDIAALDVSSIAADGCHVYLWVTHRFLPDGLRVLNDWGASYECVMTWRKNEGMTPFSWQYDTEHVLFGRIGSLPLERLGLRLSFEASKGRQSAKPDVFYERVVEASPGPRLELFSRQARDGFEAWGVDADAAD